MDFCGTRLFHGPDLLNFDPRPPSDPHASTFLMAAAANTAAYLGGPPGGPVTGPAAAAGGAPANTAAHTDAAAAIMDSACFDGKYFFFYSFHLLQDATAPFTKEGYDSALRRIASYLTETGRAGEVSPETQLPVIPMSIVSVMGFLGFAASKPGKKDAQPSFSTLNNYVSAIKFSYKQANIPVSLDLNSQLAKFLAGSCVCVGVFFSRWCDTKSPFI